MRKSVPFWQITYFILGLPTHPVEFWESEIITKEEYAETKDKYNVQTKYLIHMLVCQRLHGDGLSVLCAWLDGKFNFYQVTMIRLKI
jgi:hypothetical protein